jgi:hypothetical protein
MLIAAKRSMHPSTKGAREMAGVTLSLDDIQQAPPDVRRWLEEKVAGTFGLRRAEPAMPMPARHLVACNVENARAVLSLIQRTLPVVKVFFELAREPVATSAQGLRALQLDQMARHAQLQSGAQVVACLEMINAAVQSAYRQPDAALTALDGAGHCVVTDATARSVLALWQELVATRGIAGPEVAPASAGQNASAAPAEAPFVMSAPPFTVGAPTASAVG